MNPTSTVAGRGADRTRAAAPRDAGSQVLRAAGRQLLVTAGNQVLKAAVDRAVSKVDRTAGRLDAFAAREPRPSGSRVAGTPPKGAAASGPERSAVRAKVGASFSFIARRAMLLLQLIQRLARQLLDALARLVRRARGSAAHEEGGERTKTGRTPPTVDGTKTDDRPRPTGGATAGQAQPPRRPRPGPGAPAAPARRRVPGGQGGRTASDG